MTKPFIKKDISIELFITLLSFLIFAIGNFLGAVILIVLLFTGTIIYAVLFFIVMITTYMIFKKFFKKTFIALIVIPLLYILLFIGYYIYTFNQVPIEPSFFENPKVCRLATYLGITYYPNLKPFTYRSLAYHYREKLQNDYPKTLTQKEKKVLWEKYIETKTLK